MYGLRNYCLSYGWVSMSETRFQLKHRLENIRRKILDVYKNSYLARYRLYSEYLKVQKKLNPKYSIREMCKEFDISEPKIYYMLALRYATPYSLEMIEKNIISASKVARICYSNASNNQDSLVRECIERKFSFDELDKILGEKTKVLQETILIKREYKNSWNIGRDLLVYVRKFKICLPNVEKVPVNQKAEVLKGLRQLSAGLDIAIKILEKKEEKLVECLT